MDAAQGAAARTHSGNIQGRATADRVAFGTLG
jgi:hypothetical protein